MAKKPTQKNAFNSPDQVTEKLREGFVWTTGHSKLVLTAIVLFVVIGLGVSITGYFSEKKETTAQEKYFVIEKSYTAKKEGFEQAERSEMAAALNKDKKNPAPPATGVKPTGDLTQDYGPIVTNFESLITESPDTKAAEMAALNLSDIYLSYKKYDEALNVLVRVEKGLSHSGMLTALVLEQMATVYADKNDCKTAVSKLEEILQMKALAFAHDEAKLRMGLCYEALNDSGLAEKMYVEVSRQSDPNGDSMAAHQADKYLRLLKAKKNFTPSGT